MKKIKYVTLIFALLLSSNCKAGAKFSTLFDTFEQCKAKEFNTKINWGQKSQPKFESLPGCVQVKPLKVFKLKPSYGFMNSLGIRKLSEYFPDEYQHTSNEFKIFFSGVVGWVPAAFTLPDEPTLEERYGSHSPLQTCQYLWFKLDNLDNAAGTSFDVSGKTHNFLVTTSSSCHWGFEGVKFSDTPVKPDIGMFDYLASPFWIVQYDKDVKSYRHLRKRFHVSGKRHVNIEKGARVLYHDDAEFIKVVRPKGATAGSYPALVYGGRTFNGEGYRRVFPELHTDKNVETLAETIRGVFMSAYDVKKRRFVEAGTLFDF